MAKWNMGVWGAEAEVRVRGAWGRREEVLHSAFCRQLKVWFCVLKEVTNHWENLCGAGGCGTWTEVHLEIGHLAATMENTLERYRVVAPKEDFWPMLLQKILDSVLNELTFLWILYGQKWWNQSYWWRQRKVNSFKDAPMLKFKK